MPLPNAILPRIGVPESIAKTEVKDAGLREAARKLESGFVAEMLKSAGFGKARESFGGGAGEDAFAAFLVQTQADLIVANGGFGLAESIFQALKSREVKD